MNFVQAGSGLKRTKLPGSRAGPSFESVCQRGDFAITEQPCDFGNGQRLVVEIALGERGPKLVQNFSEGCALLAQLAGQASRAHPEPSRDFRCHGPAVRQQSRQNVLYLRTDGGPRPGLRSSASSAYRRSNSLRYSSRPTTGSDASGAGKETASLSAPNSTSQPKKALNSAGGPFRKCLIFSREGARRLSVTWRQMRTNVTSQNSIWCRSAWRSTST